MREYRSVRTWASQKSGRIVVDVAVEERAKHFVVRTKQERCFGPGLILWIAGLRATPEVCHQAFRCAAAFTFDPIFDPEALLQEFLVVNSMIRECS